MAAKSFSRGHPIVYFDGKWVYKDDRSSVYDDRPCVKCGLLPTSEGYDACLGYIPGAVSACCGHGVEEGFVLTCGGVVKRLE